MVFKSTTLRPIPGSKKLCQKSCKNYIARKYTIGTFSLRMFAVIEEERC
jgi:hypothetical protein